MIPPHAREFATSALEMMELWDTDAFSDADIDFYLTAYCEAYVDTLTPAILAARCAGDFALAAQLLRRQLNLEEST